MIQTTYLHKWKITFVNLRSRFIKFEVTKNKKNCEKVAQAQSASKSPEIIANPLATWDSWETNLISGIVGPE